MKSGGNRKKRPKSARADEIADITQGKEIEIKFRTSRAGLAAIQSAPEFASAQPFATKQLDSTYFDTPDHALDHNGMILRIRNKGEGSLVQCLKMPGLPEDGLFSRSEEEVATTQTVPDIGLFAPETTQRLSGLIGESGLQRQFETRISRQIGVIENGSTIEVALDDGSIHAGDRISEIHEVELELVGGNESDLIKLARRLASEYPLCLDVASKAEKGFRLANGNLLEPVKAGPVNLDGKSDLEAVIIDIVSSCLNHFCANLDPFRLGENPESIHQLRVALRRLRAALGLFDKVLERHQFRDLRQRAKQIANILAETRSFDALIEMTRKGPQVSPGCPAALDAFITEMQGLRAASCNAAWAAFEGPEVTLFVLDMRACLTNRDWRKELPDEAIEKLNRPIRRLAADMLAKLHKDVTKRGEKLPDLDDDARHELRIGFKKLRYGAEFFGRLFGRPKQYRTYLSAVSAMQDILGTHNDVVAARIFLDALAPHPGRERAVGYLLGWYDRQMALSDRKTSKSWKAFLKAPRFWR